MENRVLLTPNTRFVVSTSGRPASLHRYNKLLQQLLSLDAAYICIPAEDPKLFAAAMRGLPCMGAAISCNIKETIVPYLDDTSSLLHPWLGVNTIVVQDGRLIGHNTDFSGLKHALSEGCAGMSLDRVAIYGYGGVSPTAVAVLRDMNAKKIFIAGRDSSKAAAKAAQLGCDVWDGSPVQLVVNCSPASDSPLHSAGNFLAVVQGAQAVFDHQLEGRFLVEHCEAQCIKHISGKIMYWHQMQIQWRLFLQHSVAAEQLQQLHDLLQAASQ